MKESTHSIIESSIGKRKPGEIIFTTDFRGKGTQDAIKKSMSRLAKNGRIRRIAHGIYYIPKKDPVIGEIRPNPDKIIDMIARKEHIRVRPSGTYALHRLGLSPQVPTKRVYLTNGNAKQFMLGKIKIKFKPASPKKLAMRGKISSLVIQAVEEIGIDRINPEIENKLHGYLLSEDPKNLKHDLELASGKVNDYIVKLLRKGSQKND